ncbi:hypothetical protein MVA84_25820, partial [Salmonella sp. 16E108]
PRETLAERRNLLDPTGFPPREAEAPILSRLSKVSGSIPAGKDEEKNKRGWENVDKFHPNYFSPPSVLPDISPTRGEITLPSTLSLTLQHFRNDRYS